MKDSALNWKKLGSQVNGIWERDAESEWDTELVDLINQVPPDGRHVLKATAQALIKK